MTYKYVRILFIFICAISPLLASAKGDVRVAGSILESVAMHAPVPYASIRILNAADSSVVTIISADEYNMDGVVTAHVEESQKTYTGGFSVELPRGKKYIFSVSAMGYAPTFSDVDLSTLGKREYFLKLQPIYLSPTSRQLDEVVVKASRVKFYNRGDTLVYNADAFKLAEGNMLDVLIQQLPGVELKDDGSIYVNGKFVEELLLNGKHFFDNNKQLMLNNLAAYMVKNVEVYDKLGQRSELAGADLGDGQYVMDVKLKKEYMVGTILNVEGGYGTSDRYLGRLFAMAFTPNNQYAAYFNVNNLNDSRKPGQQTSWTPEKMPTGVRKTVTGGFDYNLKPINGRWELNGNVNAESANETDGTDVVRTNYLVTGNTYDYNFNQSKNKSLALTTKHKVYYKTPGGYGISTEPFAAYHRWDNYAGNVDATFNDEFNEVSADFIRNIYDGNSSGALKNLINRNISMDKIKGHSFTGGMNVWQGFKIPKSSDLITVNLFGKYNNRHDERFNRYDINFGQDPAPAETANRYFKNYPDFNSNVGAEVSYSRVLTRGMNLTLSYRYDHDYRKETSDLYRLESLESVDDLLFGKLPSAIDYESSLDRNNSYLSRSEDNNHKIGLEYIYSTNNINVRYILPVIITDRKLDYLRGDVDTTITRKSLMFDIGTADIRWRKGNHNINWGWGLKSRTPDLVSMVDIVDDTDPLFIRRGNGDLKNALLFDTKLQYRNIDRQKGRRIFVEGNYSVISNALSQGYTYDTATGIREAKYYNVNGNWSADGYVSYAQPIGKSLLIGNRLGAGHTTSVDLIGENSPELFRSKVYDLNFFDEFIMEYRLGRHKLGLNFEGQHNRFTSNREDFTQQNTWTIKSGLNAILELPANFQFATDFTVYNRRGYTDRALNTDNFVWNARLTYKAMKGKMLLMLDGYDILHDLSNVSYTVNAQARTETYRTVLPRYFMFHIQWRFNHSPKSKNK